MTLCAIKRNRLFDTMYIFYASSAGYLNMILYPPPAVPSLPPIRAGHVGR